MKYIVVTNRRTRRAQWAAAANALGWIVIAAVVFVVPREDRQLIAPMFALVGLAIFFISVLWVREGQMPLFETGTLFVIATTTYGVVPLLGFFQMHGQWDPRVDYRLRLYPFDRSELGWIGWQHVVYLGAFVLTYLVVRGNASVRRVPVRLPRRGEIAAIVLLFIALLLFRIGLKVIYGVDTVFSYEHMGEVMANFQRMPFFVQQIGHNVLSALLIPQQAVLLVLISGWRRPLNRVVVIIWLLLDVAVTVTMLGSRTATVMLLLNAGLLYHRLVKPVSLPRFIAASTAVLAAFLIVGQTRNIQGTTLRPEGSALTSVNEFQILFTNALDLRHRKESGFFPVPWQIYAVDAYMPIPSQLLPFEKIEPSTWYSNAAGLGYGLMFGVMAQAVLGLGTLELVARGVALAVVFALLHRWYVRRAARFWPTIFYLFIMVWTYSTFRATSFWFVYFIVYHFLPVLAIIKFLEPAFNRVLRRREPEPQVLAA